MSAGFSFIAIIGSLIVASTSYAQTPSAEPTLPNKKQQVVQDIKGAVKVEPEKSKTINLESPAPSPTPAPAAATDKASDESNEPESLAPAAYAAESHRFGFHGTAGIPHLMTAGLDYIHSSGFFGASLNFGGFGTKTNDVEVSMGHTEIALQYYPFAGSFFVGALVGQQTLKGKKTQVNTQSGQTLTAEVTVKSNYITPHIGWNWIWDSGFNLGFEVGYQSPSSNSTDIVTNAAAYGVTEANNAEYAAQVKDVRDKGDQLGKMGLPYLTLLKIGWLF